MMITTCEVSRNEDCGGQIYLKQNENQEQRLSTEVRTSPCLEGMITGL